MSGEVAPRMAHGFCLGAWRETDWRTGAVGETAIRWRARSPPSRCPRSPSAPGSWPSSGRRCSSWATAGRWRRAGLMVMDSKVIDNEPLLVNDGKGRCRKKRVRRACGGAGVLGGVGGEGHRTRGTAKPPAPRKRGQAASRCTRGQGRRTPGVNWNRFRSG